MIGSARRAGWIAVALVLTAAGTARAASIHLSSASGPRGARVSVSASLEAMGAAILGTQNRIGFDRATPIAANTFGTPDCDVNPAIRKDATGFRFLPVGCDPALDCTAVRVFVLSFANLDAIADGAVLYTCNIAIAADAAFGAHALTNTETNASAAAGGDVPTAGSGGVVTVESEPVATIDVGTASGQPGTFVEVPVTLHLLGTPTLVAGVHNDITFDPHIPVRAVGDEPACRVSDDLDKGGSGFAFLPIGCTPGDDCTGVRAVIADSAVATPIDDGATLYACDVDIAPGTPAGTAYALVVSNAGVTGVAGEPLPALSDDGAVDVVPGPPPPCIGDCNGDQRVVINELLLGVNIAIERATVDVCSVIDVNEDDTVTINELILAVNNALSGCPLEAAPAAR